MLFRAFMPVGDLNYHEDGQYCYNKFPYMPGDPVLVAATFAPERNHDSQHNVGDWSNGAVGDGLSLELARSVYQALGADPDEQCSSTTATSRRARCRPGRRRPIASDLVHGTALIHEARWSVCAPTRIPCLLGWRDHDPPTTTIGAVSIPSPAVRTASPAPTRWYYTRISPRSHPGGCRYQRKGSQNDLTITVTPGLAERQGRDPHPYILHHKQRRGRQFIGPFNVYVEIKGTTRSVPATSVK
jgi:hypothetical protein